jgi:hypothetical protein
MSGRVATAAHISEPIACLYGMFDMASFPLLVCRNWSLESLTFGSRGVAQALDSFKLNHTTIRSMYAAWEIEIVFASQSRSIFKFRSQ